MDLLSNLRPIHPLLEPSAPTASTLNMDLWKLVEQNFAQASSWSSSTETQLLTVG